MFGHVFVVDEGSFRSMRFGAPTGVDQSIVDLAREHELPAPYLRAAALAALLQRGRLRRALLVGLGGGAFVEFLRRHFRGVTIDVVEVDPVVVDLAHRYFGLRRDARVRIHVEDAEDHLDTAQARAQTYDFILLDAYSGARIPSRLVTKAFFTKARGCLAPGGLVVANVGLSEAATDAVLRRFGSTFAPRCFEVESIDDDNRIAVGSNAPLPMGPELRRIAEEHDRSGRFSFELLRIARTRKSCKGLA